MARWSPCRVGQGARGQDLRNWSHVWEPTVCPGVAPVPGTDLARQRAIVGAFLGAARNGDFDAL